MKKIPFIAAALLLLLTACTSTKPSGLPSPEGAPVVAPTNSVPGQAAEGTKPGFNSENYIWENWQTP